MSSSIMLGSQMVVRISEKVMRTDQSLWQHLHGP